MPARRRRYRGGFGRRRRRRTRLYAIIAAIVLGITGGAWFLGRDEPPAPASLAQCPTPSPSAVQPAASQVRFTLLNGTPRNGLAKLVGDELRRRGFVVLKEDNAPAALAGPSVVTYGSGAREAAAVLARHVLGARLEAAAGAATGSVRVVLGSEFVRLATPAEVAAAGAVPTGAAVNPSPTRGACAL